MMNGLHSIRRERASLERDRVVIGAMTEHTIANAIEDMDPNFFEDTTQEEIDELIERIPEYDGDEEEIDRILDSEEDLNLDDILGVATDDEEDFDLDGIEDDND